MKQDSTTVARLRREGLLSIVEAVRAVRPQRISYRTGLRWALHGIGAVRLESVKAGGRRLTSVPAVERFFAALDCRAVEPSVTSASVRHRRESADAVLDSFQLGRDKDDPGDLGKDTGEEQT